MKKLSLQIIGALLVCLALGLSSCNKDEVPQPNVEIFTIDDLSGEWFASENTINTKSKYQVYHSNGSIFIEDINNLDYNIQVINNRSIYIEDNSNLERYISLRR